MRVVATTHPGLGHLYPLVPLLRELEAGGDDVVVATSASFVPAVEAAGLRATAVGRDWLESEAAHTLPGFLELDARGQIRRFAELAAESAADIMATCSSFGADVVIRESMEFGGWVAARRLDIPHVECGIVPALGGEILRTMAGDAFDVLFAAHDVPADPTLARLSDYLYVDFLPPSLTPAWLSPPAVRRAFRPEPYAGSADEAPPWLPAVVAAVRPLVYVTLGTVFNQAEDVFRLILDALSGEELEIVVTVGRNLDPAALGRQPANVHVSRYIPQTLLLPHCSVVVCHAGCNTILAAIDNGAPLVCLPFSADQPLNAATVAELGIGRSLANTLPEGALFPVTRPDRLTPIEVRDAVLAVLHDESYRASVAALQSELHASPGLAAAADAVREVAAAAR